uniref:Uncharacterized protein n=1 Tax=Romanomermis culicivorax TaxID=13658 RepID=A0A915HM92_ROMCU
MKRRKFMVRIFDEYWSGTKGYFIDFSQSGYRVGIDRTSPNFSPSFPPQIWIMRKKIENNTTEQNPEVKRRHRAARRCEIRERTKVNHNVYFPN